MTGGQHHQQQQERPYPHPPARRATDLFVGLGFTGIAGFAWVVVVRVAQNDDWLAVAIYAAFAVPITIAGLGIVRLLVLWRLKLRRDRRAMVAPPG